MSTAISVHEAQVSTAQITIKTLTIGRKQVTLAAFRQLRREELIDGYGDSRGTPWGIVNYHPFCIPTDAYFGSPFAKDGHLHVVWQLGDELRQAVVNPPTGGPVFHRETYEPRRWIYGGEFISEEERQHVLEFFQRCRALWIELTELPQLFIAV